MTSLGISFYHSQFHSSWFNIKSLVFVCRSLSRSKSRSASRSPARAQKQSRSPSPSSPRGASPGGKREDSDNWSCALWDRLFYIYCFSFLQSHGAYCIDLDRVMLNFHLTFFKASDVRMKWFTLVYTLVLYSLLSHVGFASWLIMCISFLRIVDINDFFMFTF